ncbi:LuxR family transcriptional regulator [Xylanibacillus composti]|uniref:HTH luxR-type domain-containing protein n=1 Tax=Xylanibacillus composti TaxID=1572762 RepID=A0A8J4M4X8_9BACL|nr:LuxR C-terminal-related transcriptional regulator [Xylanibacillus composti]MDT9726867.1 LuxR family transcriptional regulator [Xylanibacillus composti]GIQ71361.1 hypothetical protein XYCOK13_41850 [Xylanibacillus composti]
MDQTYTTILKTKVTPPDPKDAHIRRNRLLDLLTEGLKGRLTLVTAPAGFGKTTLLTQWVHAGQATCTWLSLDDMDNDIVRFWRYVAHALAPALPPFIRERVLELSQAMPSLSIYTFLDSFLNELFALSKGIVIILDDYHVIRDTHIHDSLAYFIDYLPPVVHMMISSRSELPFSAAKWTAHNEHVAIDIRKLQFTQDETEEFYTNKLDTSLSSEQVEQLRLRTEGWAVGLQLVTLSLRSEMNRDQYIQAFSGDNRNVSDFLFHEVITKLPAELYRFLLDTSVLPRMNASIADAAASRTDSQNMLETVKQLNLFLVPLDDRDIWFRYHHLFAQFLQSQFKKNEPEQWLAANRSASKSFAAHSFMDEAIHLALEAQDFELAQEYLEQHIPAVLRRGENETLLHWFRRFPAEAALAPELTLLYAFVLVLAGELPEADQLLEKVEETFSTMAETERRGQLQSGILFVRANLMFLNGDFKKWLAFVDGLLDKILPENALFYNHNYNLTEPLMRRTPLGLRGRLSADAEMIGLLFTGNLESHGWAHSLISLYVKQTMLEGYYEWNRLDCCREMVTAVEKALAQQHIPGLAIPLAITQARLHLVNNCPQLAHDRIQDEMRTVPDAHWLRLLRAFQMRVYLLEGRTAQAKKIAARLGLSAKDKPTFDQEYMYISYVRLLGKQHKENEALRLLELMKPQAEREQLISSIVEISVLQALLEAQRGQRDAALLPIHEALKLGEQNGYVRSFVDEGPAMHTLLTHYLKTRTEDTQRLPVSDVTEEYVRKLIGSFPADSEPPTGRPAALVESLSQSEHSMLRLLNQGATNKQIAQELALSAGTVRVYLSRMYGKLGVSSRTQALLVARDLQLLE